MKDKECKLYIHTYKCDSNECDGCSNRYAKNRVMEELNEIAKQTDCPKYKGDTIEDMYIALSDVIKIIEKYSSFFKELI